MPQRLLCRSVGSNNAFRQAVDSGGHRWPLAFLFDRHLPSRLVHHHPRQGNLARHHIGQDSEDLIELRIKLLNRLLLPPDHLIQLVHAYPAIL